MTEETAAADTDMLIECGQALDITVVADFKALLQQAMSQGIPVVLDGSRIERIDCAALQLLSAFFIEARERGFQVTWQSPSQALQYAAKMTDLKDILCL